jgi:hypothetical protein
MATERQVVEVDIVTNENRKSDYFGKKYGRIHYTEPINMRGVCDMINSNGSPWTRDIIDGVFIRYRNCVVDLLSQGIGVKIDGLGTLRPTLENAHGGADSVEDFNVNEHITGVHVRFIPEGDELDRITSREMKKKCVLRKTYEVEYREITVDGKPKKIPIYVPIKGNKPDPEPGPEP